MEFKKASLTSDIIFLHKEKEKIKILLIQRKNEPFKGEYAFPGGFVDLANNETFLQAAKRELEEETSLVVYENELNFFKVCDKPDRDPRDRVISCVFWTWTTDQFVKDQIKAGDDAVEAHWFDVDDLPDLAFDHADILDELIPMIKSLRS